MAEEVSGLRAIRGTRMWPRHPGCEMAWMLRARRGSRNATPYDRGAVRRLHADGELQPGRMRSQRPFGLVGLCVESVGPFDVSGEALGTGDAFSGLVNQPLLPWRRGSPRPARPAPTRLPDGHRTRTGPR